MNTNIETIEINGVEYVKKSEVQKPNGNRAVVVINSGWIIAGDVEEKDGRIYLSRCSWVFKFSSIGFAAVIDNPNNDDVDIRHIADVDIPAHSEVYRIPVNDDWGV